MPVAAVIATKRVADAFAEGPEYFNTFGGNPVCCAAALAVLDEVPRLRASTLKVSRHLKDRLQAHSRRHAVPRPVVTVGDVRGCGLYLGVDLVTDFDSREPATAAASLLCTALVAKHAILTTLDGPAHNVLVLKPPLPFSRQDADLFLDALFAEMDHLATLPPAFLSSNNHGLTPT
mmetsp:Transcript_21631/g.66684  ORF Transcript_21631/g.66684 Transcript_21631/m.66684 type:complete len:176 (-) Transcript_21631:147-674(-)